MALKRIKTKLAIDLRMVKKLWDEDPEKALRFCRELTFDGVELSDTLKYPAVNKFKKMLSDVNLTAISYNTNADMLINESSGIISFCKDMGIENIVFNAEDTATAGKAAGKVASACSKNGMTLYYKHGSDSKTGLKDLFKKNKSLKLAVDTYQIYEDGSDQERFFKDLGFATGSIIRFGDGMRDGNL